MADPFIDPYFEELTKGNADARDFCIAFFQFSHLYDDLFDRDKDRLPEDLVFGLLNLMHACSSPFFVKFKDDLLPVLFSAAQAWAASIRLAKDENVERRLASEVLKSQYQDVFLRVAFLIGGAEHAVAMDKKWRGYKFG